MGCVLGAVLALPATAPAAPHDRGDVREAVHACKAELRELGREAFAELYESKRACVRAKLREAAAERRAGRREAVRACREQGLRGRELRDCVRRALRERREQAREEARRHRNAARECRAEREELGEEAFRELYGTNENGRNAFGKCVEQHASDAEETPESEETEAEAEEPPTDGERPAGDGERPGPPHPPGRPGGEEA